MGTDGAASFEEWYLAHHARLITVVVAVAGDVHLAAEAADEALARAYERWDRVGSMASPIGWTYRVAVNVVRRRQRRDALEQRVLRRHNAVPLVPGPAGELWALVAALPGRQRTAVVLRHVGHLGEKEIADVMGIRRSTVSSALRDAYAALRVVLSESPENAEEVRHG